MTEQVVAANSGRPFQEMESKYVDIQLGTIYAEKEPKVNFEFPFIPESEERPNGSRTSLSIFTLYWPPGSIEFDYPRMAIRGQQIMIGATLDLTKFVDLYSHFSSTYMQMTVQDDGTTVQVFKMWIQIWGDDEREGWGRVISFRVIKPTRPGFSLSMLKMKRLFSRT